MLFKMVFLKISQISDENTCVGVFFNKVTGGLQQNTSGGCFCQ